MGTSEEDITRTQRVVNIGVLYETTEVERERERERDGVLKGILNPIHEVLFFRNSILLRMSDLTRNYIHTHCRYPFT
jgi:hypothetical protein